MRNRLARLLARCTGAEEAPPPAATPAFAGKLAVAVLGIALGLTATAGAQTAPSPAGEACTFVDQTTSVEPSALKSVLERHAQVVPSIAESMPTKSWCFVPFTGNAWSAEPVTAVNTQISSANCSAPKMGEADSLFRGAREEHTRKAQEACAAAKSRAAAKLSSDVARAVAVVEQKGPQPSRCSSVLDALDRAARTPGLTEAVIVTDGQENCGPMRSIAAPHHALRSVVVLVPSVRDADASTSPAALFATRKAALLRAAPWISVVTPAWGFTPELFQHGDSAASLARK